MKGWWLIISIKSISPDLPYKLTWWDLLKTFEMEWKNPIAPSKTWGYPHARFKSLEGIKKYKIWLWNGKGKGVMNAPSHPNP